MPDGPPGSGWTTRYGAIGLDVLERDVLVDGMNEHGSTVDLFYREGFAEHPPCGPSAAAHSIPILALAPDLLTERATIEDVREGLGAINVVDVFEESIGGVPPLHMIINDAAGNSIVVEFRDGVATIHEAPPGVITNGPKHIDCLLNCANVDVPPPHRTVQNLKSMTFGAGSRPYGLPGDLTSPSRFLRVAACASTARDTEGGPDTIYEVFRILDNFDPTIGAAAAEGGGKLNQEGMRNSTIWTIAHDARNLVLDHHTQHNRRVRMIDPARIDFDASQIVRLPLNREKTRDIEDMTP